MNLMSDVTLGRKPFSAPKMNRLWVAQLYAECHAETSSSPTLSTYEFGNVSKWHQTVSCYILIWALKFEPICNEFLLSRFLNNFRKNCVGVWNVKRNIVQVGINTLMARNHLISGDDTLNISS